jgi:hypothetical protein
VPSCEDPPAEAAYSAEEDREVFRLPHWCRAMQCLPSESSLHGYLYVLGAVYVKAPQDALHRGPRTTLGFLET